MSSITSAHPPVPTIDPLDRRDVLPTLRGRSASVDLLAAGCIAMAIATLWAVDRGSTLRWPGPAVTSPLQLEPASNALAPAIQPPPAPLKDGLR